MVENLPNYLVCYDEKLNPVYVNPALLQSPQVAGSASDSVLEALIKTIGGVAQYSAALRRAREEGTQQSVEFEWHDAHGDSRLLQYAFVPEVDQLGQVSSVLAVGYDLTEHREARRLVERQARHERLLGACKDAILRASSEGELLQRFCSALARDGECLLAWIGLLSPSEALRHVASAAGVSRPPDARVPDRDSLDRLAAILAEDLYPAHGEPDHSMLEVIPSAQESLRGVAGLEACRSYRALRLRNERDETFGVLGVFFEKAEPLDAAQEHLFEQLAQDLAFGMLAQRAHHAHARAEEELLIAAAAFDTQEAIVVMSTDTTILRVNRAFTRITGFEARDVVGRDARLSRFAEQDEDLHWRIWRTVNTTGSWEGEVLGRRKNGQTYTQWLSVAAVRKGGAVSYYVGNFVDISSRKAAEQEIRQLAYYDQLTGLANRRLFLDRIQEALGGYRDSRHQGVLMFIDLDHFKGINDSFGHEVGNCILVDVARRLNQVVGSRGTVARLGGDEFAVMLKDLPEEHDDAVKAAEAVAQEVLRALNSPYQVGSHEQYVSASIGLALFGDSQGSVTNLLKFADVAMYQAKGAGRNTLRFFSSEVQAAIANRVKLENHLRRALEGGQFRLVYQAQYEQDRGIIGAEVLLRWRHPSLGLVLPKTFISLAEETGLILPIGQWVIRMACERLRAWQDDEVTRDLSLSVNVSALQFRQADFVSQVLNAIHGTGARPERLKLELTESLIIENVNAAIDKMNALRNIGVQFSMDDFGTGHSSLAYLARLPLSQLKIDQSFVRNLPQSARDALITQTIITLASSLGLEVIAEGVESMAQQDFLNARGCRMFQGYLIGRPMRLEDFEALMRRAGADFEISTMGQRC